MKLILGKIVMSFLLFTPGFVLLFFGMKALIANEYGWLHVVMVIGGMYLVWRVLLATMKAWEQVK